MLLNKMTKINQDLKIELKEEMKTLKRSQVEMRKELKNSVSHLENSAEDRLSVLGDKVEDLDE